MDFDKLDFVRTANPQMKPYDFEIVNPQTGHFLVTEKAMLEFDLHNNGLTQVNQADKVYLGITDSDRSVFFKTTAKGETKFRKFKNINLMTQLSQILPSINKGDKFVLNFIENYKHYKMFEVVPYNNNATPSSSPQPEVEEKVSEPEAENQDKDQIDDQDQGKILNTVSESDLDEEEQQIDLY